MTTPDLPKHASPLQMRKALVRMRIELHRQELRYESLHLTQPLQEQLHLWQRRLNLRHAPLWGLAGATLLGFLGARSRGRSRLGSLGQGLRLTSAYLPLLVAGLRLFANRQNPATPPPQPPQRQPVHPVP